MPLVTIEHLTKYYGSELLLEDISLTIDHRDRVGLIGPNGVGKTTLCRILMGEEPYEDNSRIHFARGTTVGYLAQDANFGSARTPWEAVLSVFAHLAQTEKRLKCAEGLIADANEGPEREQRLEEHARLLAEFEAAGGFEYERKARTVLTGLGVGEDAFHRDLSSLSGGEQRRVALARLLLTQPSLLLLDEPTNHLDIAGTEWLETYLKTYPGAVVVISHDRWFLDAVVHRILELEWRTITEYTGGYTDYMRQKQERLLTYQRQYQRQQEELKRQLGYIRWALGTGQEKRVRAAKSRLKLLERMEYLDPPPPQRRRMRLRFEPRVRGGDEILELAGVGKRYGDRWLFRGVTLHVRRGERVGIVGPNGCGKTTLLRVALGIEPPTEGEARLGRSVEVGYHKQEEFGLDPNKTVFEEFRAVVPDAEESEIRSLLARFLFVEDDVFALVGNLSGGEQCRLSLGKLMMTRPTLLVLDEPTNHLDIDSRNALEAALRDYQGTVIVVSHDRYFLDNVVSRLLVFDQQAVVVHEGNYASLLASRRAQAEAQEQLAAAQKQAERQKRLRQERLERKAAKTQRRQGQDGGKSEARRRLSIEEIEQRAQYLEGQLARIRDLLGRPETYATPAYVAALNAEYQKLDSELAQVYEAWEQAEAEQRAS